MHLPSNRPPGIAAQDRTRRFGLGDFITLASFSLLACTAWLPHAIAILGAVGALTTLSSFFRFRSDDDLARLARSTAGTACLCVLIPWNWYFLWPIFKLVPLVGALAVAHLNGSLRGAGAAFARGRLGRFEMAAIGALAVTAAALLILWFELATPDLSGLRAQIPGWPAALLVAGALTFAVVNALLEEIVWRGIMQTWLATIVAPLAANVIQAILFGLSHFYGVPSGWTGVALATGYALLLGGLRWKSGGLLAPIVAHIAADLVIFAILAGALA